MYEDRTFFETNKDKNGLWEKTREVAAIIGGGRVKVISTEYSRFIQFVCGHKSNLVSIRYDPTKVVEPWRNDKDWRFTLTATRTEFTRTRHSRIWAKEGMVLTFVLEGGRALLRKAIVDIGKLLKTKYTVKKEEIGGTFRYTCTLNMIEDEWSPIVITPN